MTRQSFLLEARAIVKRFGPTSVLRGVDFLVAPGEIHALLGGNGAGKSTLLKIVAGDIPRDSGELKFAGDDMDTMSGAEARAGRIAVVHQELALLPHLSVAENIALPSYHRGLSFFRAKAARQAAFEALSFIDQEFATVAVNRRVGDLALHERQLVEIARALGSGAQLLLLDEPTANLTAGESERLFGILRRLVSGQRISVVFVSHRMREIRQIADVCTIIRDGLTAADRSPVGSLSDTEIIERMGQQAAAEDSEIAGCSQSHSASKASQQRLFIHGPGVALAIGSGQIVGLAGAPAGPSRLIDALIGERPASDWTMRLDDKVLAFSAPATAARSGIGYVSGDRANKGIIESLPIVDNVMATHRVVKRQAIVSRREASEAQRLLGILHARVWSVWQRPSTLSGGTQQKLLIARWLGLRPSVLVLEEPTRGVDIGTKRELYALIRQMADSGTVVIWWSTEHAELTSLCDIVIAFDPHGQPTSVLNAGQLTDESLAAATGMAA